MATTFHERGWCATESLFFYWNEVGSVTEKTTCPNSHALTDFCVFDTTET